MTAAEQDELSAWLAADPRNRAVLGDYQRHWRRLDVLAEWRPEHAAWPNPDLLAPVASTVWRRWIRVAFLAAASGAILVSSLWHARTSADRSPPVAVCETGNAGPAGTAAGPRRLADGTRVELGQDAQISVDFTPKERRVRLQQGEAHFFVTKDRRRPFIVTAAGVDVRAVGTAFNVRVNTGAVEVLVTEGSVQVDTPRAPGTSPGPQDPPLIPQLGVNQRAVVPIEPSSEPPQVATLTAGEIERVLAWQHRVVDFNATPLNEIVAEFNRRNVVQLVIIDPELASLRVSARLRSDNIEGFVRLLVEGFGARAEKRGDTEILLRQAK